MVLYKFGIGISGDGEGSLGAVNDLFVRVLPVLPVCRIISDVLVCVYEIAQFKF